MLMTPGPTRIPQRVRQAMAREIQNPDLDPDFAKLYEKLEEKLQEVYGTKNDVLILGGEGILGIEASIASMMNQGDKVLCISNGIFGDGFADFVKMYKGEPTLCSVPYGQELDLEIVESAMEEDFKLATIVHCETPTGVLNDITPILKTLKERGVITIVDAVSSLGGCHVPVEYIDVCIGGSQKCFSSAPGLTTVSISETAWKVIENKEQNTYYTSFKPWKDTWYGRREFPYTHLVSNIYGLDEAINMLLEEGLGNVYSRHKECAKLCRDLGRNMGLELYPSQERLSSPTVTAFELEGRAREIPVMLNKRYGILLGTSLGSLKNDVLRVGHMGANAHEHLVKETMSAAKRCL